MRDLRITDSTPWHLDVELEGRAARIPADASTSGQPPDFLVYLFSGQVWADGGAMDELDQAAIAQSLPAVAADLGWTVKVLTA